MSISPTNPLSKPQTCGSLGFPVGEDLVSTTAIPEEPEFRPKFVKFHSAVCKCHYNLKVMSPLEFSHPFSAFLMISIPVLLALYLIPRFKAGWGIWWVGGITFIASQVGHVPFNIAVDLLFERGWLPAIPQAWGLTFSAIFLGLSSGIWEEWFRWIAYRWWVPQARSWKSGIVLGAGHGGMEAILLGLISLATFINILVLKGKDLSLLVPTNQLQVVQTQLETYWSLPWYYPLLGPVERLFTIPFHITASVIVLQAFQRAKLRWVWLSVAWHAAINGFAAVYLPVVWREYPWWPYAVEGVLGLSALINIAILFALKKPEPETPTPGKLSPSPAQPIKWKGMTPMPENLDKTRYLESNENYDPN
jgi:uncharacterized membrane protein YhfC